MIQHRLILVFILASLCWSCALSGQKLRYEVTLFGKKIGETTIEARDSAGGKYYKLRSSTQVKMLFMDKRSSMSTDVLFSKDGIMSTSIFKNIKEDGIILTQAIWDNGKLIVEKNGEKSCVPGPVKYSSLLMYFSEPSNIRKVFSERMGKFFDLVKEAEGKYSAEMDNSSAIYTYSRGRLSELEIKSSLGSIFVRLVN
ncbi:MAG: hypothetical protein JST76_04845 [Bacteroidetes bacterium]|nr:hypothetical protein [Bacteroidota bacterium]